MNMKISKEKYRSILKYLFLHIVIFQLSLGGVLSKFAASHEFLSFQFFLYYGLMIVNLGVYAILWQQIIKKIPLTTAFCNKSVSIIWGMMWGAFLFQEVITWNMIVGAVIVVAGVILVVKSDE